MLDISLQHRWDVTPEEAIHIQEQLRHCVIREDQLGAIHRVAGVDVGFEQDGKITRAAVAVLSFPGLQILDKTVVCFPTSFPYVPGLLSFREAPAVLEALARLNVIPDLLFCDGQGYAHPRRFGFACHVGVLANLPSIGVAKTILVGNHQPVGNQRGDWQPLLHQGEQVGVALRTKPSVRPVYVSIGHRISLETAVEYVLRCTGRYRLVEPVRQAHHLASQRKEDH